MAEESNGHKVARITSNTLLPLSLVVLVGTMIATLSADRARLVDDIDDLKEDLAKVEMQLEETKQKLSNYRAQVDQYRTEDYRQAGLLADIDKRLTVEESKP